MWDNVRDPDHERDDVRVPVLAVLLGLTERLSDVLPDGVMDAIFNTAPEKCGRSQMWLPLNAAPIDEFAPRLRAKPLGHAVYAIIAPSLTLTLTTASD